MKHILYIVSIFFLFSQVAVSDHSVVCTCNIRGQQIQVIVVVTRQDLRQWQNQHYITNRLREVRRNIPQVNQLAPNQVQQVEQQIYQQILNYFAN